MGIDKKDHDKHLMISIWQCLVSRGSGRAASVSRVEIFGSSWLLSCFHKPQLLLYHCSFYCVRKGFHTNTKAAKTEASSGSSLPARHAQSTGISCTKSWPQGHCTRAVRGSSVGPRRIHGVARTCWPMANAFGQQGAHPWWWASKHIDISRIGNRKDAEPLYRRALEGRERCHPSEAWQFASKEWAGWKMQSTWEL